MTTKRLFALAAALGSLAVLAAPASAFIRGGLEQTFGTRNYRGTYGYVDVGDALHVKPSFNVYRSDVSSGTFKTFKARLAYDTNFWGLGLTLGGTGTTNDYSNRFFGLDGTISITPSGGRKSRLTDKDRAPSGLGLARIDLGGALKVTHHTDRLQAAPGRAGIRARATKESVVQSDVTLSAGVEVLKTVASADLTHSKYNKDLEAISARTTQTTQISGLSSMVSGFPKNNTFLRLEWDFLPVVSPYVAYSYTTYMLNQPPSRAYIAGAYFGFQILEAKLEYEHFAQRGGSSSNYVTLGGAVRF